MEELTRKMEHAENCEAINLNKKANQSIDNLVENVEVFLGDLGFEELLKFNKYQKIYQLKNKGAILASYGNVEINARNTNKKFDCSLIYLGLSDKIQKKIEEY